ncbi:MAG: YaiI/YqxD family protein [Gammaproteobacteria bacterium]|nr:MAG: YaiI/YqxD family protein [Gammaproteobacteria bacterium]
MQIWVDVDTCPVEIKNILTSAVKCTGVSLTLITKRGHIPFPDSNINLLELSADAYSIPDREMAVRSKVGDLVITDNLNLAVEVMEKGARVMGYKGETYTPDEIEEKKKVADFIETMRSIGAEIGNTPPLSPVEKQSFISKLGNILVNY